jgi:glutamine phosphoribosylpyrophosphate amidotransferase
MEATWIKFSKFYGGSFERRKKNEKYESVCRFGYVYYSKNESIWNKTSTYSVRFEEKKKEVVYYVIAIIV